MESLGILFMKSMVILTGGDTPPGRFLGVFEAEYRKLSGMAFD